MQCSKCHTENDTDSKFCKECGQRIAATQRKPGQAEPVRIGELIYAAYKHKEAGRIDEALAACQDALILNPQNASAHALLGSLYESKGDLDAAVSSYELVLELDPASEADREHLEELRQKAYGSPKTAFPVDSWRMRLEPYIPHISAIATLCVVLVACMVFLRPSTHKAAASDYGVRSQVAVSPVAIPNMQNSQPPLQQQQRSGVLRLNPVNGANQQGAPPILSQTVQTQANSAPNNNEQTRPDEYQDARKQAVPNPSPAISHPAIIPVIKPIEVAETQPSSPITPADPPVIRPVEHQSAGSAAVEKAPVNYEERAIQVQSQGRYEEAISDYREALSQTHDKGRIYQQIGMCYQRLGERDQAVDSYNKAIAAFHAEASAGKDPAEVEMDIKSCQRAIEVNK